jgi:Leu/Phe-tRNA-protein transferase
VSEFLAEWMFAREENKSKAILDMIADKLSGYLAQRHSTVDCSLSLSYGST